MINPSGSQRRENCRPRPDHHPRPALANLMTFIVPFPRREMAVQHRDQRS